MYHNLFKILLCLVSVGMVSTLEEAEACGKTPWIVDAKTAKRSIDAGATVLDVRAKSAYVYNHTKGAVHVTWQEFSQKKGPRHGKLLGDAALQKRLRAKGVFNSREVIVVGNPRKGWGEEGRIVWMLRTLGHKKAAFVDGGQRALNAAGITTARGFSSSVSAGDFTVSRTASWAIDRDQLKRSVTAGKIKVVDTRERREYNGAVPYGESRPGHVPGAVHLYYKDFLGKDGKLLPRAKLEAKLAGLGITKTSKVAAYCTGGIRSAWFVAVLEYLGYADVKNYAGSMWEWAASEPVKFPLER